MTELATNFLHQSDKLVFGSLILLSPKINSGEDSAFPMVSSSSSASHKYEGTVSLDCAWWKMSVVSE